MAPTLIALVGFVLSLTVSPPVKLVTLDDPMKGEPTQLSWSEDGSQFLLQTSERGDQGTWKNPRYYAVSAADGRLEALRTPPDWAAQYWTWKSNKFAPGSTTVAIDIKAEQKNITATSSPMGGGLAKGGTSGDPNGGGTTADEVASHRSQTQTVQVVTLRFRGETVGEFAGVTFIPGYSFGWSPKALGSIAYTTTAGKLAVIDADGKKQQIDSTKNVILPAWSTDGKRIAFVQKNGKKFEIYIANVTQ